MRYATVVIRRTLTRLTDDWHRRRLEQSADAQTGAAAPLQVAPLLHTLARQMLMVAVVAIRFMAVASPPTSSSSRSGSARGASSAGNASSAGAEPGAGGTARPTSATSATHARSADSRGTGARATAAPITASSASSLSVNARLLAADPPGPRLPGAHPVAPAALRREAKAAAGAGTSGRVAHALVGWLQPIGALLAGSGRLASSRVQIAETSRTAPSGIPGAGRPAGLGWAVGQRLVGGAVAVLVLVASVVGVSPVHTPVGGTGNVLGAGVGPRLAIGGGSTATSDGTFAGSAASDEAFAGSGNPSGVSEQQTSAGSADIDTFAAGQTSAALAPTDPSVASQDIEAFSDSPVSTPDGITPAPDALPAIVTDSTGQGPYLADGTILKPIAVDTTIPDARSLLSRYTVRKGDTLTSIASHFGISMVTLYWANHLTTHLKTKTDLKIGQSLSIPPVNGVLHIVTDNETLTDISKRTGISVARIVDVNGLKQPTVFVGQWIIVPGARAKPVPEVAPKPRPVIKPVARPTASAPTTKPVSRPTVKPTIRPTYTGGGWVWPAPGGHISQYYHYGHWAIDIADDYGAPVLAAKPGIVTFAGWKNNGGGWQVWISHGNGVYTTYNHMSSLTVGSGQSVGAGSQVGRIGMTGHATGPHLHFEVWLGPIWDGGSRVNPLNYV